MENTNRTSLFSEVRQNYFEQQKRAERAEKDKAEQMKRRSEIRESLKEEVENDATVVDDTRSKIDLFDRIDEKAQRAAEKKKDTAIREREAEEEKARKKKERAEKFNRIFHRKKRKDASDGKPAKS